VLSSAQANGIEKRHDQGRIDQGQRKQMRLEQWCSQPIPDEEFPMALPHAVKRIRLDLARSKEFPTGSAQHGYEFVAPLDGNSHIDAALWRSYRGNCKVRRFWQGENDKIGEIVHKPGGQEHARWVFDYDKNRVDDDEAGYRFGAHAFAPGEYVTISDQDQSHTFRVVSVEPAA
jgi:hypothetical protein